MTDDDDDRRHDTGWQPIPFTWRDVAITFVLLFFFTAGVVAVAASLIEALL
jgi:hypothetical protein